MNHETDADSGLVSLDSLPQMVLEEVLLIVHWTQIIWFLEMSSMDVFPCPFGIIAVGCHLLFAYFLAGTELNLVA
ncbi:unnamed protein product [Boreogadus saida]